jgi:hypothetical protein
MPITYAGPHIAPTFVAGVINDAWTKAASLIARARTTQSDLEANTITPAALDTLEAVPTLVQSLPAIPAAGDVPEFDDPLTDMLAAWIDEHFPDTDNPNAAAAWARIVLTFSGSEQTDEVGDASSRLAATLSGFDADVQSSVQGILSTDSDAATAGAERNKNMIDYRHRKAIDLSQLEVVMRTQLDALDAARSFLIEAVYGLASKEAQELARVASAKQRLQDVYFQHLSALVEAESLELGVAELDKRITADASIAEQDRETFMFRQRVTAALAGLESLAHQAQGAINRASASATVGGGESSP